MSKVAFGVQVIWPWQGWRSGLQLGILASTLTGILPGLLFPSGAWALEALHHNSPPLADLAQTPPISIPPQDILPPSSPLNEPTPPPLPTTPPAPGDLLPSPPSLSPEPSLEEPLEETPEEPIPVPDQDRIVIQQFRVINSTVFTPEQFQAVTAPYTNRPITFAEILEARSAVTALYREKGYITSGAIFPPQRMQDGVVTIEVVEGSVEEIVVQGTTRLQPGYISSRVGLAVTPPLNVTRLLDGLQLLQQDPLIETISADLQAGTRPGSNRLVVTVTEADSFQMNAGLNNGRVPTVGSVERQLGFTEGNLLGLGDRLTVGYTNTNGSNEIEATYGIPLNPYNGKLLLGIDLAFNRVIDPQFEVLQIHSTSRESFISVVQPIFQTPDQEFSLGLGLSHSFSQTWLGLDNIGPFPLTPGADEQGRTAVTALSFSQTWAYRDTAQVVSAFSQFNLGLGWFGATVNATGPDSRFFSWQGQGQWVRLLAPDTILVLRGSAQLANEPLLSQEQFGLGGQATVRGYRQDLLLTDNAAQASLEVRFPVLRVPEVDGLLQVTPFIDGGYGWNVRGITPSPQTLVGIGTGLLWQQSNFLVRFDWGIPLVPTEGQKTNWQANGLYFTLGYTFF